MINSKERKNYYREVEKKLICSHSIKKKTMKDLKLNINNYLIEFPNATLEEIRKHFGEPEDFEQYNIDHQNLIKKLHNKNYIKVFVTIIFMITLSAVLFIYYKLEKTIPNYSVEYIEENIIEKETETK